jgi:hypothetical protein
MALFVALRFEHLYRSPNKREIATSLALDIDTRKRSVLIGPNSFGRKRDLANQADRHFPLSVAFVSLIRSRMIIVQGKRMTRRSATSHGVVRRFGAA